ncbi:TetR/AcrR family transcriptional regulator [Sphingobium lactosutens]|uniref:TetR family transcriptional regulator n=1 Tax=Sphingobium lactosutens DS20 TaxID=1331060 RepID=T0IT07_9SPHN|nr:TetR family transcriptional regulator [Sphingobium lactosutens]EQB14970.1 TetR family transcriptional regulator [Sphingobium lactosutens DS20]
MTFQRARNEEQREARRRAILDTTVTMLNEMPVAEVSLNELSRRVGLAKSNVMRYFESREAVLLELLSDYLERWLVDLAAELAIGVEMEAAPLMRTRQMADVLSRSLATRPVLCDLFGAQGGVLEHNVSVEVIKRHKRASQTNLKVMTDLALRHIPELGEGAQMACLMALLSAGALSAYTPPPPSLLAAYEEEPALGALHMEFANVLRASIALTFLGALPRD